MICRWCGAQVSEEAEVCPHCGLRLKRGVTHCPYCKEKIRAGLSLCPYCGYELGRRRVSWWLIAGVSGTVLAVAALALFFLPLSLPSFSLPTIVSIASPTPTEISLPPTATPEPPTPTPTGRLIVPTPTLTSTPTPTSTSSPSPTSTRMPTLTSTATFTPTPLTPIPTATPAPPPTDTPTPTGAQPFKYQAPRLKAPVDQEQFRGINTEIWLEWESVGTLAEKEWYVISVRFTGLEGQIEYGWDRVRERTTWRVPKEYHSHTSLTERAFQWDIRVEGEVVKPDGSVGGMIPISPTSETWVFYWR